MLSATETGGRRRPPARAAASSWRPITHVLPELVEGVLDEPSAAIMAEGRSRGAGERLVNGLFSGVSAFRCVDRRGFRCPDGVHLDALGLDFLHLGHEHLQHAVLG